jgi:hypothetical protein
VREPHQVHKLPAGAGQLRPLICSNLESMCTYEHELLDVNHHFAPPAKRIHELERADVGLEVLRPESEGNRVAFAGAFDWEEADLVLDP